MKPRGRRNFGPSAPTKAMQRSALRALLIMREKPLSDADIASLARSYGVAEQLVRDIAREVRGAA